MLAVCQVVQYLSSCHLWQRGKCHTVRNVRFLLESSETPLSRSIVAWIAVYHYMGNVMFDLNQFGFLKLFNYLLPVGDRAWQNTDFLWIHLSHLFSWQIRDFITNQTDLSSVCQEILYTQSNQTLIMWNPRKIIQHITTFLIWNEALKIWALNRCWIRLSKFVKIKKKLALIWSNTGLITFNP